MDSRPDPPSDVLILGAGFSRAVSAHLPLADALGHVAFERARAADPGLFLGSSRGTDE